MNPSSQPDEEELSRRLAELSDPDRDVSEAASDFLWSVGQERAVPALANLLSDRDASPGGRERAARTLMYIGSGEAVEALIRLTQDGRHEAHLRRVAVLYLGQMRNRPAQKAALSVAQDPSADPEMRLKAVTALSNSHDLDLAARLEEVLNGADVRVVTEEAERGLRQLTECRSEMPPIPPDDFERITGQLRRGRSLHKEVTRTVAAIRRNAASRPTIMRPRSYIATIVRESEPGDIPGCPAYPKLPVYPGLTRVEVTVWSDGVKWRERHRCSLPPPSGFGSLAPETTARLPARFVSDGWSIWYYELENKTVHQSKPSPAGTWPSSQGFLKHSVRLGYELDGLPVTPLEWVLRQPTNFERTAYLGRDEAAGRRTHVVQFDLDSNPHQQRKKRKLLAAGFDLLPEATRFIRWFDEETFFALREEEFTGESRDRRIRTTYVTSIHYNVRLPQRLFDPIVPKGYRLVQGQ